jgi:hypothetical protein
MPTPGNETSFSGSLAFVDKMAFCALLDKPRFLKKSDAFITVNEICGAFVQSSLLGIESVNL